ncbi:MAG: hypothetical protein U0840_06280 [Gemmataceae bacterium]
MATGEPGPIDSQTSSPASLPPMGGDTRIPLPPPVEVPTQPASNESLLARLGWLDALLALLVVAFGFLCGSFRAANSDLFQHLAAGRTILKEGLFMARDPFSFAAEGTWVNHSWLYDVVSYLLYSGNEQWGGAVLVVIKALMTALASWFMLRAATRPGQGRWLPAVLVVLAVLAMSPRLLLQPVVVSILLLALLFSLLLRSEDEPGKVWLLPVICLVWVNLDVWFFLGPVTVLLYFLGEHLEDRGGGTPLGTRLAVVGACFAACLVNPSFYQAFLTLPQGLLHTGPMAILKEESAYRGYFLSPWQSLYFSPYFGLCAAGLAYHVLVGLGVLSFVLVGVLSPGGLRWSRIFLFVASALLSSWTLRAIPFFAILAGPITALNFHDLAAHFNPQEEFTPGSRRWAVSGRVFTLVVFFLLIGATLPGWLQALPHYRRQVAWGIEVDKALRDAALTAKRWREEGALPKDTHWFNATPDVAYYFAWFCPEERTFVDGRMELYPRGAVELARVRRSLSGEGMPSEERDAEGEPTPAWRTVFTDRDIQFYVFHNADLARATTAMSTLSRLYSNPQEFVPCFTRGNTAIFAWNNPEVRAESSLDGRLPEKFSALAFGKEPVEAPDEPARSAAERSLIERVLQAESPTPPGSLTALQHTIRFDARSMDYQIGNNKAWVASMGSALVGLTAAQNGPLAAGILLPLRMQEGFLGRGGNTPIDMAARELMGNYLRSQDSGPVSSLYLAVRAGRQALAENPDDTIAQLFLAEAYTRLTYRTRERGRISQASIFPHAQMIRQAQVAAALQNLLKVAVRPEQERAAHQLLVEAYAAPEYFEVRIKHIRDYLKIARQIGGPPGVPPSQFAEYLKLTEERLKEMTSQLKNRRDQYEVNSANKPILEKANIAIANGLCETAYNLLLRADPKDLRDRRNPREAPGVILLASIMLGLGRVDEVRDILLPDPSDPGTSETGGFGTHPLGLPALEWLQAQYGAATGDYRLADEALARMLEQMRRSPAYSSMLMAVDLTPLAQEEKPGTPGLLAGAIVGHALLTEAQTASGFPWQILRHFPFHLNPPPRPREPGPIYVIRLGSQILWRLQEQQADILTLRAWLALESGRLESARRLAQESLKLSQTTDSEGLPMSQPFRSRPLAELILELVDNRDPRD